MTEIEHVLDSYNIQYMTSGKNVLTNFINIKCPFCNDDPSHHLCINKFKGYFFCWRDSTHKGSWYKLKQALQINIIENDTVFVRKSFDLLQQKQTSIFKTALEKNLKFPNHFLSIDENLPLSFKNYLKKRNLDDLSFLKKRYNLYYCKKGSIWGFYLIFPIYFDNYLVSWLGRYIGNNKDVLKYRELEPSKSVIPCKNLLYNFHNCAGGKNLFIVEGVFDVIKIEYLYNTDAVAILTKNINEKQKNLIFLLSKKYKNVYLLLDADSCLDTIIQITKYFTHIKNLIPAFMYKNDPGDITSSDLNVFSVAKKILKSNS